MSVSSLKGPRMAADLDTIFAAASRLSDRERLVLATRLLDSISNSAEILSLDDEELLDRLTARRGDDGESLSWGEIRDRF